MEPRYLKSLAVWEHRVQNAKARVLHVHGISEHSGRHTNTFRYLTGAGYDVVRFDLRGSGRSGGRRQWVSSFDDYVFDTATVHNWICSELDEKPLFLMGHSLGGAIATHFTALYGHLLRGLCLTAPAYLPGSAIPPVALAAAKVLVHVAPSACLPAKTADARWISRDAEVCKAYMEDPLACHTNTLQQGTEVLKALALMPERASRIDIPVMIAHGSADRVIKPEGSFTLLRSLASHDKTLHYLPGGYHELHNDIDKETFFKLLGQWLDKHV